MTVAKLTHSEAENWVCYRSECHRHPFLYE